MKNSREPLTLVIHADKAVTYDQLVHLTLLARDAGIHNALLATLPRSRRCARPAMNDARADSATWIRTDGRELAAAEAARRRLVAAQRWLMLIAFVFAAQVALIFVFGGKTIPAAARRDQCSALDAGGQFQRMSRWMTRRCLPCRTRTILRPPARAATGREPAVVSLDGTAAAAGVARRRKSGRGFQPGSCRPTSSPRSSARLQTAGKLSEPVLPLPNRCSPRIRRCKSKATWRNGRLLNAREPAVVAVCGRDCAEPGAGAGGRGGRRGLRRFAAAGQSAREPPRNTMPPTSARSNRPRRCGSRRRRA